MKNKLLIIGVASLLMTSCTVVYQARPSQNMAYNNDYQVQPQQDYQQSPQYDDGYSEDWDADTSASPEPKIDFNNGAYDDGYVYNPAYFNSNFYAGNPFWGLGMYSGWNNWAWGPYAPFGWGLGVGYGWGGYYGWGSIYSGWGGAFGWPGYNGWGYSPWSGYYGHYHNWGYAPYIVNPARRHTVLRRKGSVIDPSLSNVSSGVRRNTTSALRRGIVSRDMNLSNTRGVRSYTPAVRNNSSSSIRRIYAPRNTQSRTYQRNSRTYSPPVRNQSRSYSPPARRTAPTRSYSPPTRSYSPPARSSSSSQGRSYSPPSRGRR